MKSKTTTTKRKPMRAGGSAGQMNRQRRNSATSGDETRQGGRKLPLARKEQPVRGGRKISRAEEIRKSDSPPKKPVKRKKMQAGGSPGENLPRGYQNMSPGRIQEVMKQNQESGERSSRRAAAIPPSRSAANRQGESRRRDVAAKRLEDAVSVQRTGGGNYGTYQRGSQTAASFREAYASAKRAGKDTFTWRNRRYTTE